LEKKIGRMLKYGPLGRPRKQWIVKKSIVYLCFGQSTTD
jgi:hypothetical protein